MDRFDFINRNVVSNPFVKKKLRDLCTTPERKLARFLKYVFHCQL